jgi:1,4-alpha-glucan branching enzyme
MAAQGLLALVLHAHLPYVRHPEHRVHLEESWLFEAVTATYLPLLEVFRGLVRDGARFRLTMTLSPPLLEMLADDLLKTRTAAYLDRLLELGEEERARHATNPTFLPLAEFYAERFGRLKQLYDALSGDLIGAFQKLEDDGVLEIATVGATHAYQPTLRKEETRRAQIRLAVATHHRHFGRWPGGIWLPECGYSPGVESQLAEAGLRYFFTDAHGLLYGRPRPPEGAPVLTRAGVAAFGRDQESGKQVWSSREGYPGDPNYRDFYRDVGFDLPLEKVRQYIHPDGIRQHTGYKYYRVTGPVELAHKEVYVPSRAAETAATHAGHFLLHRTAQVRGLGERMDRPPLVVAPYDAELYGHWWFEGPQFLDFLVRKIHFDQDAIELVTPSDYLARYPKNAVTELCPSSWGEGGYSNVWIDGTNDWIYRHQHRAEIRMGELAERYSGGATPLEERALNQAARELMLLLSSDWAFILKTQTATGYALSRIKAHVARFRRLDRELCDNRIDEAWLGNLEGRDRIFPDMNFRIFAPHTPPTQ